MVGIFDRQLKVEREEKKRGWRGDAGATKCGGK